MKSKLIRVISPLDGGKLGTLAFPPISLGILYRHLRDRGFDIEQDDLHRRWWSSSSQDEIQRLRDIAQDDRRMWMFLEGSEDGEWQWFGDKSTSLSDFTKADIVLLSMISTDLPCAVATLSLARYLKKHFNPTIVLGGEYFACAPIYDEIDRVLQSGAIDYYIGGFGEEPLEQLLNILAGHGSKHHLANVPGLCYLHDNGTDGQLPVLPLHEPTLHLRPRAKAEESSGVLKNPYDLRHPIVPPAFEGLPMELYRWSADCPPPDPDLPRPKDELTLPFHTSTGCPYDCSFCECSGMTKMTILPPHKVVEELEKLVSRYGCRTFFFLDNTLNVSPRYIDELCNRIIEARLDIQWMDCASGRGIDRATLQKMRRAGVVRIVWGLEAGNDRILEYVRKPVRLEGISKVLHWAHEAGIWNGVECIVGLPSETESEFQDTMRFLEGHAEVLDEVWCYRFYLNSASDMLMNHGRYGIINVRRVNKGLAKGEVGAAVAATHIFDEKDGLCWEDKDEQQKRRLGIMLEHIANLGLYPMTWEHEQQPNLLSWCYRQRSTKVEIRTLYRRYWEKLSLRRTWGPAGRSAESVNELVEEIYQECKNRRPHPMIDKVWGQIYPDKWNSFFPASEVTSDLSYERRLLIDGRYHDSLVYSGLKKVLNR